MGQYAYLINKEKRICCEAHKISGGGQSSFVIEEPEILAKFMNYCMVNKLQIYCVSEHWFEQNLDLETEQPYTDFV